VSGVIAVVLAVLLFGAATLLWLEGRGGLLAGRLRRRVIVNLKDGQAFGGVLFDADRDVVILRNAESINGRDDRNLPVDGEVVILRSDVAWLQLP
jgi:small nuclear ribonucleoprotein (snRNP)-like protein